MSDHDKSQEESQEQESQAPNLEAALKKAREEAARRRIETKELKAQLAELEPLANRVKEMEESQKSELQKAIDRQNELEAQLKETQAKAERQTQKNKLLSLGASSDYIDYVDLDRLPWDDEEKLNQAVSLFKKDEKKRAETPAPANGKRDHALTMDAIKNMSREEIAQNMEQISKSGLFSGASSNKI